MVKNEKYKGYDLDFFISRKGFNSYVVTATKYKVVGDEQYYKMFRIDTYTSKKTEAFKIAKKFIDANDSKKSWSFNNKIR